MELRNLEPKHAKQVSELIGKTFLEFVAPTFTKKAKERFLEDITEQNIIKHIDGLEGYVATEDSCVVGVIMASIKKNKITTLFVDKNHHHKGIATSLVEKIEDDFRKSGAESIRCWASVYAVPFYKKQGFKKTRGIVKNKKGYTYQPMKKML